MSGGGLRCAARVEGPTAGLCPERISRSPRRSLPRYACRLWHFLLSPVAAITKPIAATRRPSRLPCTLVARLGLGTLVTSRTASSPSTHETPEARSKHSSGLAERCDMCIPTTPSPSSIHAYASRGHRRTAAGSGRQRAKGPQCQCHRHHRALVCGSEHDPCVCVGRFSRSLQS